MLIMFLCTAKEMDEMNKINFKMDRLKLQGETPDFLTFMEEVDNKFSEMEMLHILADLKETLRRKEELPEKKSLAVVSPGYN